MDLVMIYDENLSKSFLFETKTLSRIILVSSCYCNDVKHIVHIKDRKVNVSNLSFIIRQNKVAKLCGSDQS